MPQWTSSKECFPSCLTLRSNYYQARLMQRDSSTECDVLLASCEIYEQVERQ